MTEKERENLPLDQVSQEQAPEDQAVEAYGEEKHGEGDGHHHHSSHHHSHHSHHRSRHKKRRKSSGKRKIKKFFKKHKKILIPIAIVLLIAVVLGGILGTVELISDSKNDKGTSDASGTDGTIILAVGVFDEEQSLVNGAVDTIMQNHDYSAPAHVILKDYLETTSRLDVSMPVKLSFHIVNKPADYVLEKFVVRVGEDEFLQDARQYELSAAEQSLELYNLKTGTRYYFKISAHFENGVIVDSGSSFQTKASPRILSVSGAYNVRDVGGWLTADGRTIKQGLLYRGTELDGAVEPRYTLTQEGRNVLLNDLGIRMEMDLRWEGDIPSDMDILGESVIHRYYNVGLYTDVFVEDNQEAVRAVFSDLANPDNYPIYMHCTYGRDRTGTICCLLEALLGVQEEDLWRDYQLSALEKKYLDSSFDRFMTALQNMEGQTLQEKAENYLLSIGVTEEEIASIRQILLG